MQKQAPTLGRLAVMVGFTLSCFGLLLFLWNAFGGPIPLKPKGYRYEVAVPAATQLAQQADVRMAGVSIGKVVATQLDRRGNRTLATVQLSNAAAPISSTSRVMLRQKTLLGETYLDVTPGRPGSPKLREGSRLPDAQVKPSVQLDEIFTALDPTTRRAFHTWQQTLARGVRGRATDLSDALGNLPGFAVATHRLIRELRPAAHDLAPTVRSARLLAPDLRETFTRLDPLIAASKRGLPALRDTLRGAQPLLSSLGPFLEQLNPILNWLELYQHAVADFTGGFGARAIAGRSPAITTVTA